MVMMLALYWIKRWIWLYRVCLRKQHFTCILAELLRAIHTLMLLLNIACIVLNRETEDVNPIVMPTRGIYVYIYIQFLY